MFFAFAAGCAFGPQQFKGVMSYRGGKVFFTNKDFYRVGKLPDGWNRLEERYRTITFYNESSGASISTDAFCGRSLEGRRPDSLTGEILTALDEREVISEKEFELSGRGAVRILAKGKLDGVAVTVDLVVVRKDGCIFDFYAVSEGDEGPDTAAAFEQFFGGFDYRAK
jgi:hypothetical protein